MKIDKNVSDMISRYGDSIKIIDGEETRSAKAIIQPLMYKNKMYLDGTSFEAGNFDGGHYQMIAPPQINLGEYKNVRIEAKNMTYILKRVEMISSADTDLYIWAVLTPYYPQGEDDYGELNQCA